jgi:AraC-like DNA-binding protein
MCQKKEGTDTEADGKENSTSLLFTFTIRAPWYATTLAKIIYVLLMMILICATYYIIRQQRRIRHERKERAQLLAQARQKEQELLSDNEYLAGQLRLRLMEQSSSEEELSGDEKFLLNITRLIEENMDNTELNVNLLSQKSGISTKQLYRRIKSLTGMTAVAYIRDQRLKKAASLLAKGSFTVSEVMYRVGFSSPSYFTRCFCDEYGVPPSEYKTEES